MFGVLIKSPSLTLNSPCLRLSLSKNLERESPLSRHCETGTCEAVQSIDSAIFLNLDCFAHTVGFAMTVKKCAMVIDAEILKKIKKL